jgi:hypothetical protein
MIETISILCYYLFPPLLLWWLYGIRRELNSIFVSMKEIDQYYNEFIKLTLTSDKWVRYIILSNELTGKAVKVRKCIRRVKQAHAYYSDYKHLNK